MRQTRFCNTNKFENNEKISKSVIFKLIRILWFTLKYFVSNNRILITIISVMIIYHLKNILNLGMNDSINFI